MGPYLSVPKKEKDSVFGENKIVSILPFQSLSYPPSVDEVWSYRHARLEKHHGGLSHR